MNFEEVYKEYLLYARKRHKKQGFYCLSKDFNSKILIDFKNYDITDISENDILEWQNRILERNYRNSYNFKLYHLFVTFLDFCCTYYGLKQNVARNVGNFCKKIEVKSYDFYTLKEFRKFSKCIDDNVYKQYFNLLFYTGVRPSEAMALKFSDLNGNYISITKNLRRKGDRGFDTPKTQSSIRDVRIDRKLKRDLLKLKKYYIKVYGGAIDYFIFGGLKPLAPTTIDRYKKRACEKANLRVITQHQFRHSHATMLVNKGIPLPAVQKRLGHSSLSITSDIYVHYDKTQEKRVYHTLNFIRHFL